MSEQAGFRDFGILPEGRKEPPETVRAFISPGRVAGQYIATAIVAALGVGLVVLFVLTMPQPLSLLGGAAALTGFGAFVFLATHNDYRWVELEGNTLRAKHLYSGRVIERSVEDIESLGTMVHQDQSAGGGAAEKLPGHVKGVEIRFRDQRTPLHILRADPAMTKARQMIEAILRTPLRILQAGPAMTNAEQLIEGVLSRMQQVGELDAEVVNFNGQPLVRRVFWKGEQPASPPGKALKLCLCLGILLALLTGAGLGYEGLQAQERREIGSVPSHVMTVRSLIENGPGDNRHVTLTGFVPGGYAVETKSGSWTSVWVALFPAPARLGDRKEIEVVFSTKDVRDEAALGELLRHGRLIGICSATRRSSWGTELGPKLVQANQGGPLSSAWSIEELREPPSAGAVKAILGGSSACFAAVLVFAFVVFWKAA